MEINNHIDAGTVFELSYAKNGVEDAIDAEERVQLIRCIICRRLCDNQQILDQHYLQTHITSQQNNTNKFRNKRQKKDTQDS